MSLNTHPLWSFGFRPFFLCASAYSVIAMVFWMALFNGVLTMPLAGLPPVFWHAHEMLFGYATAVIAGFLLTAVRNWTQLPGLQGKWLALLVLCWLIPRTLFLLPIPDAMGIIALFDLLFICGCAAAVISPIVASGQLRRQAGIVAKLVLLGLSHLVFFVSFLTDDMHWLQTSLYSALYLIVALSMALARRLIPFFMKSTTGIELPNPPWIDQSSLWLFLMFWLVIITLGHGSISAILAAALLATHGARLWRWRSAAITEAPLLWVLYVAYGFFLLGFLLLALQPLVSLPLSAAIHAFTAGGIGTLTIGMMSRVSWGHTGRKISQPPRYLGWIFCLLIVAAILRVGAPILWPEHYTQWTIAAAAGWALAFSWFLWVFFRVLTGPRVTA